MNFFAKIFLSIKAFRELIYLKRHEILMRNEKENFEKKNISRDYNNTPVNYNIGKYSYIAQDSIISNCKIGKFCSIGPNTVIGVGEHPTNFISTSPVFYLANNICGKTFSEKDYFDSNNPVIIGNDVWIGANVFIKNGIKIGNGAIIAAGAVVVNDIPDYAIAGGVPARIIRYRFDIETVKKLLKIKWWDWEEEKLKANKHFFITHDISLFIKSFE